MSIIVHFLLMTELQTFLLDLILKFSNLNTKKSHIRVHRLNITQSPSMKLIYSLLQELSLDHKLSHFFINHSMKSLIFIHSIAKHFLRLINPIIQLRLVLVDPNQVFIIILNLNPKGFNFFPINLFRLLNILQTSIQDVQTFL